MPLGLYRGDEMVEHPFDQDPLTERYTEEAVGLIEKSGEGKPFSCIWRMRCRTCHWRFLKSAGENRPGGFMGM